MLSRPEFSLQEAVSRELTAKVNLASTWRNTQVTRAKSYVSHTALIYTNQAYILLQLQSIL